MEPFFDPGLAGYPVKQGIAGKNIRPEVANSLKKVQHQPSIKSESGQGERRNILAGILLTGGPGDCHEPHHLDT
jgi:hypothetical protein